MYQLPPLSAHTVAQYNDLDGPPAILLQHALHATNEAQADALAAAFVGDRQGYANTRQFPDATGACTR